MYLTKHMDNIRERLTEWGITYFIAGGFPRDMLHSILPKDLDIIVYNTNYSTWFRLVEWLKRLNIVDEELESYNQSDSRIICVLKLMGSIDIIYWNPEKYKTEQDVLDNFDFNINQFVLLPDNKIEFRGNNFGKLTALRPLTEVEGWRVQHMKNKARMINWNTECLEKTTQ